GVAMGGIYGNCATTALEDAPLATRGLLSGILQQGYAFGYILATAYQLGNLISSASSTIEATLGQRFPLKSSDDTSSEHRFDYGK
ncbi:unnamed protein product, partial [Rotaria sp. Silwood2]